MEIENFLTKGPDETFALGERIGQRLGAGSIVLLRGGLGAGKTLLTKGIVHSLGFDADEVTSPSFALVNLYKTEAYNIYHIDLWRIESGDAAFAVGLPEILEEPNLIVIIEWAERLGGREPHGQVVAVEISGDGDDPRQISVTRSKQKSSNTV